MEEEWQRMKTARSSSKRGLRLVVKTSSEVLMTDCSVDDVKKTYQDVVGVVEAFLHCS